MKIFLITLACLAISFLAALLFGKFVQVGSGEHGRDDKP